VQSANRVVKNGPVFPKRVALAMDVWRTPKKKNAKWRPRKTPAKTVSFLLIELNEPPGEARL
jgi:hypothetical protein